MVKDLPTSVPTVLSTERLREKVSQEYIDHAAEIEKFLAEEWPKIAATLLIIEKPAKQAKNRWFVDQIQLRYETADRLRQNAAQFRKDAHKMRVIKAYDRRTFEDFHKLLVEAIPTHAFLMEELRILKKLSE